MRLLAVVQFGISVNGSCRCFVNEHRCFWQPGRVLPASAACLRSRCRARRVYRRGAGAVQVQCTCSAPVAKCMCMKLLVLTPMLAHALSSAAGAGVELRGRVSTAAGDVAHTVGVLTLVSKCRAGAQPPAGGGRRRRPPGGDVAGASAMRAPRRCGRRLPNSRAPPNSFTLARLPCVPLSWLPKLT